MFRLTATRTLVKSLTKGPASRLSYSVPSSSILRANSLSQLKSQRTRVLLSHPRSDTRTTTSTFTFPSLLYAARTNSNTPRFDKHRDPKEEQKVLEKKIEPHPENVSTESSIRHVFEPSQGKTEGNEVTAALKSDIQTIKDTFTLDQVPKESLYIGIAGILPYAATSLSTTYLAWDINHAEETGSVFYIFTPETAHQLLDIVTPIQIGYGAVIISFLGAVHWGLEFAGYGGYHSYRRYMYGVIAPAVAWPTIYMPIEYALITQFFAFNFLYFADARATVRGWFPPWYSTYRFVLTFFVGASIVFSLIGRGQIVQHEAHVMSPVDYVKEGRDA